MRSKVLKPEDTREWLQFVAARALRKLEYERRRREFRETLKRIRMLSGR